MKITFGVDLGYFLWSLVLGAALALLYDMLRSGRRLVPGSVLRVNLEDLFFVLLSGVLLFFVAYDKNGGCLRIQGFLGTALGILGYYFVFRDRMVRGMVWLSQLVIQLFCWVLRVLSLPVRVVFRLLSKPFLVIAWYSKKSIHKVENARKRRQKMKELRARSQKAERENQKRQKAEERRKRKKKSFR
ncbi:MAG: hypothetical protein IJB80_06920 [Clostridia bacterium]|nr:hypothetical protein [Clostridia bacterium]